MRAWRKTIYLPGDSFPADEHVRQALEQRLRIPLHLIEERMPEAPAARLVMLKQYFDANPNMTFTLFGRSSGCRVVTQLAADPAYAPRIDAVIALSYPFRHPDRPEEPERYAHLPHVRSRCLIAQGTRDQYNGERTLKSYGLSRTTAVFDVPCCHNMWLEPPFWDLLAATIGMFMGEAVLTHLKEGGPELRRLCA